MPPKSANRDPAGVGLNRGGSATVEGPVADTRHHRTSLICIATEDLARVEGLGLIRALEDRGHRVRGVAPIPWRALDVAQADVLVLAPGPGDERTVASVARLRRVGVRTGIAVLGERALDSLAERFLDAGADLFLSRKQPTGQLATTLEALARRVRGDWARTLEHTGPDVQVDITAQSIRIGAATAELRPTSFRLMLFLLEHFGRWVTEARILRDVFETNHAPGSSIVRVHICSLRRELEPLGLRIEHRRHAGYRLAE